MRVRAVLAVVFAWCVVTMAFAQEVHSPDESGVQKPVLETRERANYTMEAWDRRIEGRVLLAAVVKIDGGVDDITVTQSLDSRYGLDEQAVKAVRQWKFKPGSKNGEPVAVRVPITITFTLAHPER